MPSLAPEIWHTEPLKSVSILNRTMYSYCTWPSFAVEAKTYIIALLMIKIAWKTKVCEAGGIAKRNHTMPSGVQSTRSGGAQETRCGGRRNSESREEVSTTNNEKTALLHVRLLCQLVAYSKGSGNPRYLSFYVNTPSLIRVAGKCPTDLSNETETATIRAPVADRRVRGIATSGV